MRPAGQIPRELRDLLIYDRDTGSLSWIENTGRKCWVDNHGYLRLSYKRRSYFVHRVAYFIATGEQPAIVDHRDRDPLNNRYANLRPATPRENIVNRAARSPYGKGVALHKSGRFQAQIKFHGKNHYLGLYGSPEEASAAYFLKASELFGEFACA